jgi:hypothetical protein
MIDSLEFESINSCKYLFLRELLEPRDNSLLVIVQQAVVNYAAEPQTNTGTMAHEVAELVARAHPVESVQGCKTYKMLWRRYAAYLVTEECVGYAKDAHDEVYQGNLLRFYTKSHFLDHLAKDTSGHIEPLNHYRLLCENHRIDVASYKPPEIVEVDSDLPLSPSVH